MTTKSTFIIGHNKVIKEMILVENTIETATKVEFFQMKSTMDIQWQKSISSDKKISLHRLWDDKACLGGRECYNGFHGTEFPDKYS